MINGIIIIDKPKGYTSFDIIAIMRKILNIKKIGHAGTLDPMATGVLPILIGSATKAQDLFLDSNKEYIAEFQLGITTDTLDITGNILNTCDFKVTQADIKLVTDVFKGHIKQKPPMYSAIKKDGKKLYEFARKGIEIERKERDIFIKKLDILDFNKTSGKGTIKVLCSKGTYIRSLCDDIGNRLGCGAVLSNLRRTKACGFDVSEAVTIEDVKENFKCEKWNRNIIGIDKIFYLYKSIKISQAQSIRFKNGGCLDLFRTNINKNFIDNEIYRIYNENQIFLGLGKISEKERKMIIYKLF